MKKNRVSSIDADVSALRRSHPIHFVGRELESETLRESISRCLAGQASITFVSGEIGIGKTTLVREVSDAFDAEGVRVVAGLCYDLETTAPYSPWIDLARFYSPQRGNPPLPDAIESVIEGNVPPAAELAGKFEDFLKDLAGNHGVLLILDDLHWSDQASLEMLRILTRRIQRFPIAIVVTYRDTDLTSSHPLFRMLPILVREANATRVHLRRLGSDALATLIDQRYGLPPADRRRLVDYIVGYAEGNPFFTEEILHALEAERILHKATDTGGRWSLGDLETFQMPALVLQVIEGRLATLDERSRDALQIAAVIGQEIPLRIWQQLSGLSGDDLAQIAEEAMRVGLIEELPGRQRLSFRHALVREALHQKVFLLRRRALHREIADILAAEPAPDPDTVAHHYYLASDQRAAYWLIEAARRSIQAAAYLSAARQFEEALAVLRRDESRRGEYIWLLFETAEAYRYVDTSRALGYLDSALDHGRAEGDDTIVAVATWLRGRIRAFAGENSLDELDAGVVMYESLTDDQRQRIRKSSLRNVISYGTLSQMLAHFGRHKDAIASAERFFAMLEKGEIEREINEVGEAHMALALSYAAVGELERSRQEFERSRRHRMEVGNHHGVAGAYDWEYVALDKAYFADDAQASRRTIALADSAWSRSDFARLISAHLPPHITEGHILLGEWDEARARADACSEIPVLRSGSALILAELDRLQGFYELAEARIRRVLPKGPDTEPSAWLAHNTMEMLRVATELQLDQKCVDEARRWAAAYGRWARWTGRLPSLAKYGVIEATVALAAGELDRAEKKAQEIIEFASSPRQPLPLMSAHRILGDVATLRGDEDRDGHLAAALRIAQAAEAPYEIARCYLAIAQQERLTGNELRTRELLDLAQEIAERIQAHPLLEQIEQARRSPAKVPTTLAIPGGLSQRELEVLKLVARGMTDAEVAEQLFISPRTVGRHLSSIYDKLGVNSRTAATAFAYEHDLASGQ
ncbi:MAG: helix-turn-helix transcriptional regulator [Chloroflexota bacterium]